MNKNTLYILLLCSPLFLKAQDLPESPVISEPYENASSPDDSIARAYPVVKHDFKTRKFEEGFKDKYNSPEFTYETQTGAKSLWDRFWAAVRRFFDSIFSSGDKATGSNWFAIFMRSLAILVTGFVVYMIVRLILKKEGIWIFGRSRKKVSVSDVLEEDIHQMDFSALTQQTKESGDYRLAIRYYYLWLLKKMSNRDIIEWNSDKTNSDYLYEIKDINLKRDFEYLSYLYDYSWYGEFLVDGVAFAKAEKAFSKTFNKL